MVEIAVVALLYRTDIPPTFPFEFTVCFSPVSLSVFVCHINWPQPFLPKSICLNPWFTGLMTCTGVFVRAHGNGGTSGRDSVVTEKACLANLAITIAVVAAHLGVAATIVVA